MDRRERCTCASSSPTRSSSSSSRTRAAGSCPGWTRPAPDWGCRSSRRSATASTREPPRAAARGCASGSGATPKRARFRGDGCAARDHMTEDRDGHGLTVLEAAFAQSRVGLAVFDEQFRFVRVNEALAQINRRPVEAHLGHTLGELVGDAAQETERLLREVIDSGRPLVDVELFGPHPDAPSEVSYYQATYTPILGSQGSVVGVSAVVVDVTARRRSEQDR